MKQGYRTSEFWLTLISVILGALYASGIFTEGSIWHSAIGLGIAALAGIGYTAGRSFVKGKDSVAKAIENTSPKPKATSGKR